MNIQHVTEGEGDREHRIEVSVATPNGAFPAEGFDAVLAHQRVEEVLQKARHALKIEDTSDWVVRVFEPDGGSRSVDPGQTYRENALHNRVKIEWHPRHTVDVSISTTAGFFPAEGFNSVPVHQKVEEELIRAKSELKIKDTAGWVASVIERSGKRQIEPSKTYQENGLAGKVEIDWGPSEGGGG